MSVSERLLAAASRILAGDDSRAAADELLGVLIDEFEDLEDPRIDELVYGLCLYGPGEGRPYLEPLELRVLIRASLLALDSDDLDPQSRQYRTKRDRELD